MLQKVLALLYVVMWSSSLIVSSFTSPSIKWTALRLINQRAFSTSSRKFDSADDATFTTTLDSGSHQAEIEIKKSRFIGYAKHVETWRDAQSYLEYVHGEHPKARHVCFGFVAGSNPVQERCSDDGEPTGTAGLPILTAIKGEGLSDTVCVVVRYFGGIKLGAGGLIRAYGNGAREVLRAAPQKILIPKSIIRVCVPSSFTGSIYECVNKVGGVTSEEEYTADGNLLVSITCETKFEEGLLQKLSDSTRGEVELIVNE
mmetsp:Transcript_32197/g.48947  ORF Transcript_32197/g.48947 Transcript_32197/m.48947 type:complete len:258 (+) Transcript_32197:209-982(+)